MRISVFRLALLLLALSAPVALAEELLTAEQRQFGEDVRWIWSRDQQRAFQTMSGAERDAFMVGFWDSLDPSPGTPRNEFKEAHYARIQYANAHFTLGKKGQFSDRGRYYIVFGPPSEVVQRETTADDPQGIVVTETQVWTYDRDLVGLHEGEWLRIERRYAGLVFDMQGATGCADFFVSDQGVSEATCSTVGTRFRLIR